MRGIAPSLLSADFGALRAAAERVAPVSAALHLDVMDGHFVPNLTMGPDTVRALRGIAPLDVHLMVTHPGDFIAAFVEAGADVLTVHVEATDIPEAIAAIREAGPKVGLALRPSTPLSALEPYLDGVDLVLVMSVEPGFGGQRFDPAAIERVREVRARAPGAIIEVDGGVNRHNAVALRDAGADLLVAGSAVFGAEDPVAAAVAIRGVSLGD